MKRAPLWLFVFALAARAAAILLTRFDGLYGQDAFAYFDYARQIFITPAGQAMPGPFYWPLGYPALAALFFRLSGISPLGAQAASALSGAAIAPLVYLITIEIESPLPRAEAQQAALAAGSIAALSGQLIQSSIAVMADAPALFWAALSAYGLIRHSRRDEARWLVIAAASLALAIISRWIFAGLIWPFGIYAILALRRAQAAASFRARFAAPALAVFLLAAIAGLHVSFSQRTPAPLFTHNWVVNWDLRNALQTSFDNPDGHFDYALPPALFYAQPLFHPFYLLPLLTPFAAAGLWLLRRSPEVILLGGWAAALYLYLIGVPYENFRFGLAYFPPIALFAGLGLFGLHTTRINNVHRAALLAAALALSAPFTVRGLAAFLQVKSREVAAMNYLAAHIAPRSTVLTFGLTLALDYYTDFNTVDLSEQSPGTIRDGVSGEWNPPRYLYVERENIETQWLGRAPAQNLRWLESSGSLREIGRLGTWTLYEITGGLRCARPRCQGLGVRAGYTREGRGLPAQPAKNAPAARTDNLGVPL